MNESQKLKFSQWLSNALNQSGLNQSALARTAKVSKQHINGFLALAEGRQIQRYSHPSVEVVDRIARALGVPVNEARDMAGYAPVGQLQRPEGERLLEYFNALPEADRSTVVTMVKALYDKQQFEASNVADIQEMGPQPKYTVPEVNILKAERKNKERL